MRYAMKAQQVPVTAILIAVLLVAFTPCAGAKGKLTSVTLEIDGVICSACVDTVEEALRSVKGVEEAKLAMSYDEATVRFDPTVCKVEDLIEALKKAEGMSLYEARVKKDNKSK
jgi:copper chaperone CopZ